MGATLYFQRVNKIRRNTLIPKVSITQREHKGNAAAIPRTSNPRTRTAFALNFDSRTAHPESIPNPAPERRGREGAHGQSRPGCGDPTPRGERDMRAPPGPTHGRAPQCSTGPPLPGVVPAEEGGAVEGRERRGPAACTAPPLGQPQPGRAAHKAPRAAHLRPGSGRWGGGRAPPPRSAAQRRRVPYLRGWHRTL